MYDDRRRDEGFMIRTHSSASSIIKRKFPAARTRSGAMWYPRTENSPTPQALNPSRTRQGAAPDAQERGGPVVQHLTRHKG